LLRAARASGPRSTPVAPFTRATNFASARSTRVCANLNDSMHVPHRSKSIVWQIERSAWTRCPNRGHCNQ
jgi:hypothetical protein